MQPTTVKIEKPDDINFILGQTHFIKSVNTVKPDTVILHGRADDVVPFADSEELIKNSGLPASVLVEVGTDHRLADPEPLAACGGAPAALNPGNVVRAVVRKTAVCRRQPVAIRNDLNRLRAPGVRLVFGTLLEA